MKTLAEWAGIPIAWNKAQDEVLFDTSLTVKETKARLRGQLRPVLPDDESCDPAEGIQYWMYNGISLKAHEQAFKELNIQYELTLLYPKHLGRQRSKTLGHIHTFPPSRELNYPEVCEVLWGEAIFVFQTLDLENRSVPNCYAVQAKQGDKVVFPPNWHHFTVNAADDMLLFSDFISLSTTGNYQGLSSMGGGAYLYEDTWTPNPKYARIAPLQLQSAPEYPELAMTRDIPLYELIWRKPELLRWLDTPDAFGDYFPELAAAVPIQ